MKRPLLAKSKWGKKNGHRPPPTTPGRTWAQTRRDQAAKKARDASG